MSTQHAGSCLCGAVRFRIRGELERFYLCHCSRCRKGTGSAHAANLFSASATLDWLSGQDRVTTYNLPGTRHTRSFCSACGSTLPYAASQMLVVPAGCLDTALDTRPDAHIFAGSRTSWDQGLESVPVFEGFPA